MGAQKTEMNSQGLFKNYYWMHNIYSIGIGSSNMSNIIQLWTASNGKFSWIFSIAANFLTAKEI